MTRANPLSPSFNAGELTPRLAARTDFRKYSSGLDTCENLIPMLEGGLMRRPATRYVAEVDDSSVKGRVKRFEFSTTQAYMTELGDTIMRFYRFQGQIVSGDTDAVIVNGTFAADIDTPFSHVWQVDDTPSGNAFVDETANANSAADADWTLLPATEAIGDYASFGYTQPFSQIKFDYANGTAGIGGTVAWEYWDGSSWTALSGVSDGTTGFTVAAADGLLVNWTVPTDWTAVVINTSASLYWVRARVTGTYGTNPILDQGFINAWRDVSTGGAGNQISHDSTNQRLTLETSGTAVDDIGWAELPIVVGAAFDTNEHVLKFRVIGAPSDRIELRIGTTSSGDEIVSDVKFEVGYHCYAFTPGDGNNLVFVQFRNLGSFRDKDVQIDDVSLIDDSAVEIDTPYLEADLFQVDGPQSADILYLFHEGYPTYKLLRLGHTSWSLVEVAWEDGPWLPINAEATTLTPSATTGLGITLTLSAATGVNDDQGWLSTDVGRLVRYSHNDTAWGYAVITSITTNLIAVADVRSDFGASTAQTTFRLGAWSGSTGYPSVGAFYEQRLFCANNGSTNQPQTFWASQTSDFENHTPDNRDDGNDGTVEDDDALDYTISADNVNAIKWMSPGEDTLVIGTTGGEWIPVSTGAVITPSDVVVRRQTTHGSADVKAVRVGNIVLFLQRAKRKIREFGFTFEVDGYRAFDMTRLAEHISKGGLEQISYQEEPGSLVWSIRSDGQMPTMTFRREEDVVGWARHIIGGSFGSGDAIVESVDHIPGANGAGQVQSSEDRDEVWITVKRTINGATKRYIEVFEGDWEDGDDQEDAYYADSIITYDGVATSAISGLDHLEGETVKVYADGAIAPDAVVASGSITLETEASVVQIGLGYRHRLKTLKVEAGAALGTAVGKTKQIFGITFVVMNSHTMSFGPDSDNLTDIDFREVEDLMDTGVPFFTGEYFAEFDDDWLSDARVVIESDDPTPFALLALAPEEETRETRG